MPAADGAAFLEARLRWVIERRAAGERPVVVLDLDNTVFDTRWRTLAVAREFDALRGSAWFQRLAVDGVRRDGRATALEAGLGQAGPELIEAFHAFWEDMFWRPESFAHDAPIPQVVAWARAARAADAELRFLTGRVEALHAASLAALTRIGLGVEASALVCKPRLGIRTGPWKCGVLTAWAEQQAAPIGWYLTEGRRDTTCIQAGAPQVPCVLLDCSFEASAIAVRPGTPVLARCF